MGLLVVTAVATSVGAAGVHNYGLVHRSRRHHRHRHRPFEASEFPVAAPIREDEEEACEDYGFGKLAKGKQKGVENDLISG